MYKSYIGPSLDRHATFLESILARPNSPFITGARFTAADVQLHMGVEGLLADKGRARACPKLAAYSARLKERPAYIRAEARDAELEAK